MDDKLLHSIENGDEYSRFDAISKIEKRHLEAYKKSLEIALISALYDENLLVRASACTVIGKIGLNHPEAIKGIIECARDSVWLVKVCAIRSIGKLHSDLIMGSSEIGKVILEATEDGDPTVRQAALKILIERIDPNEKRSQKAT